MNRLERPKFPPPPKAIVPSSGSLTVGRDSSVVGPARSGATHVPTESGVPSHAADQGPATHSNSGSVSRSVTSPDHDFVRSCELVAASSSDGGRATFPDGYRLRGHVAPCAAHAGGPAGGVPDPGRAAAPAPAQPAIIPPAFGGSTRTPAGPVESVRPITGSVTPGRDVTGPPPRGGMSAGPAGPGRGAIPGRMPLTPGEEFPTPNPGRMPSSGGNGIVGGRPTVPSYVTVDRVHPPGNGAGCGGPDCDCPRPSGASHDCQRWLWPQPVGRAAGIPGGRTASPNRGVIGGSTQESSRAGSSPAVGKHQWIAELGSSCARGHLAGRRSCRTPRSRDHGCRRRPPTSDNPSITPNARLLALRRPRATPPLHTPRCRRTASPPPSDR